MAYLSKLHYLSDIINEDRVVGKQKSVTGSEKRISGEEIKSKDYLRIVLY